MQFDYTDRTALETFDDACIRHGRRGNFLIAACPALRLLYDQLTAAALSERETSRRIALALEIKLASIHGWHGVSSLAGIENQYFVPDEKRSFYRPLEDDASFSLALRRSKEAFSLIARIRAIWDKLFLYVVMICEPPSVLSDLENAKSKKRFFFSRYANGVKDISSEDVKSAKQALDELETTYRTPELHKFGSIRGWAFDTPDDWMTPYLSGLMEQWNAVSHFIQAVFREASTSRTSLDL